MLTAIFDIGRTNKKLLLFDEQYRAVEEISETLPETTDEDGFPCDDLALLTDWVLEQWQQLRTRADVRLGAVNTAAYGASFVHLDAQGKPLTPLYSYLKPYPADLAERFYATYGEPLVLARQTCSPPMGMLNSGLQLYWLKYRRPEVFDQIHRSLHLPQYIAYLLSGQMSSDYTSIGCHTTLWDYEKHDYHDWVRLEGIEPKLAPVTGQPVTSRQGALSFGGGLHDSSSVIMAYLSRCPGEFMVLSTGTWTIVLNPFAREPLTDGELRQDCLSYLTVGGALIKASRIFLGREHDHQVARIAAHFNQAADFYKSVSYRPELIKSLAERSLPAFLSACMAGTGPYPEHPTGDWDLSAFQSAEEAYHQLLVELIRMLAVSVRLADSGVPTLYVDGGFARNGIFMQLLANEFPGKQVYTSQLPQATAIGAALYVRQDDEPVAGWTFERVMSDDALMTAVHRSSSL